MLIKDSFHLTNFPDAIKYWKMWKIIFTQGFISKQIEHKRRFKTDETLL